MSAASRRGSNLIRQQIADEQKDSAYWVGRITAETNRADRAEARLEESRKENEALKAQLQDQKVLQDQITELEKKLQNSRAHEQRWTDMYFEKNRAHSKLSLIVRMAMSPEQYRDAREDAARVHPQLFERKEV